MPESDTPRLRVLLACDWFVKYAAGLAGGLLEAGCEVGLLTRDHDLEFGGEPGAMRDFLRSSTAAGAVHFALSGRVRDPRGLLETARLRRTLGRWNADVVHVQDSLANDLRLGLAAHMRGGRYALTVHDPVPHPGDAAPARGVRSRRRRMRRRAGLVFVHSRELANELAATGEVTAPIDVVPHGVGAPVGAPLPSQPSLLFFGRISRYKGLDVLLDAMPRVWSARSEVTLTVAGEGALPEHPLLSDPRISLRHGHVPESEVPGLFAACTCLVLPYRQASQSGVGSLAREHGRAVIATRVGGLPELVTPDWGRLVPSEDPPALAAAILELVQTPGLADELGRAATTAAAGWETVAVETIAAYRRHLL